MVFILPSDLQIDTRQDEFPTTYRGNQDEFPTTHYVHPVHSRYSDRSFSPPRQTKAEKLICGLRKTTFWLSILAAAMLALGIVGSSVAGSIAARKKSSPENACVPNPNAGPSPITMISSTASSSSQDSASTSLHTSSTISFSPPAASPTNTARSVSDCQNTPTPYVATVSKVQFDISCETQNLGGDFMSFQSSTLEICIDACANFNFWVAFYGYSPNLKCSLINYDNFLSSGGNCWLKESGRPDPARTNQSVISASLKEAT